MKRRRTNLGSRSPKPAGRKPAVKRSSPKRPPDQVEMLAKFPVQNPNPVLRIGRDGSIRFANPGAKPLLKFWKRKPGQRLSLEFSALVEKSLATAAILETIVDCGEIAYSLSLRPIPAEDCVNVYGWDVTASRRAEEELKFRNLLLAAQLEVSLDGILVIDDRKRVVCFNKRFLEIWRIPVEVIDSRSDQRALEVAIRQLADPAAFLQKVNYLYDHPEETSHDEILLVDGRILDRYSTGMVGPEGKDYGRVWYFSDITERKRAQERLYRLYERFQLATRSGGIGVWDWDVARNLLIWDNRMYQLYGIVEHDFGGAYDAWAKGLHPEDRARAEEEIQLALRGEKEFNTEFRVVWPDGSVHVLRAFGEVARDLQGRPLRMIGVNFDITDRREAEEIQKRNSARLLSLVRLGLMSDRSLREVMDFGLEEAVQLAESEIGYIFDYSEEKRRFTLYAWNYAAMNQCTAVEKPIYYELDQTGLWGEAVRQRRPVITNDYAAPSPLKKGCPEGHVPVKRHLNLPIFLGEKIVAVIGVGNKKAPYTDEDVQQLQLFASGLWNIIERKRSEQSLRHRKEELERFEQVTVGRELKMVELKKRIAELEKQLQLLQPKSNPDPA